MHLYQFEVFNTDENKTYGYIYNAHTPEEAVIKAYCGHGRLFGRTGDKFIKENISKVVVDGDEVRFYNFKCTKNGRYLATLL